MSDRYERRVAELLGEIGESVEVFYEPRNEGMEWYVGLADAHGAELPLHEHFPRLLGGLEWLLYAKGRVAQPDEAAGT